MPARIKKKDLQGERRRDALYCCSIRISFQPPKSFRNIAVLLYPVNSVHKGKKQNTHSTEAFHHYSLSYLGQRRWKQRKDMKGVPHSVKVDQHFSSSNMIENDSNEPGVACSSVEDVDRSFASVLLALRYSNDECERELKVK
jgi:hypothetical protein